MKFKKIIALILILLISLSFCACKSRTADKEQKQKGAREIAEVQPPKPESRAEPQSKPESKPAEDDSALAGEIAGEFLKAARTGEREEIQRYADYNKLFGLEPGQEADWILQQVLMRMKYEIVSAEKKDGDDKATVGAKITNIDMNAVLPLFFQEAMQLEYNNALSDKPKSQSELDKEYRAIFAGLASKNAEQRVEKSIDIELSKKDGNWEIKPDTKLGDAMLGGYITAREKIATAGFEGAETPDSAQGSGADGEFDYDAEEFSMVPPKDE